MIKKNTPSAILLALLLAVAPCTSSARTDWHTGNDLKDWIDSSERLQSGTSDGNPRDSIQGGMLLGFISASVSFSAINAMCFPPSVTSSQLIGITKKYIDSHPENLHLPASMIVWDAWKGFLCKKDTSIKK